MRRSMRTRSARLRSLGPKVDRLENRELLSTSTIPMVAQPMFEVGPLVAYSTPPPGAYTPAQIQQAYRFNQISFKGVAGTGSGETIAIVDAYDDPNIQADLDTFDAQFGLPSTTVTRVNQTGGTSVPAADSTGGWELEESLDVEWAHAMAPGATILLVEANSAYDSDLLAAVDYASAHANVVSMSWGGGEFSGQASYDSHFSRAGVAFVASSGDNGAPISWPASSPNVLAVGGTALTLGANNVWSSETGWSGSGGGPSAYETQPSYQAGVVTQTTNRANPDVAYDASPSTGFAVYDSYNYSGTSYGWVTVGGTSAGAPQWAALLAIADQGRVSNGQPALDSTSPQEVMTTLYKNPGDFHDITTGTSTGSPNYTAGPGYDYVTGIGSPLADLIIGSFDGTSPASNDQLVVTATTAETAGTSFNLTITAENASGATDTGYLGTIHFTSSDAQAVLPANYTLTATDKGSHTFAVTLKTAASQSITATDVATSAITGTLAGISVSPAAASQFVLSGLASTATAGVSQTSTVTARDAYGNVATSYTGTVHFTSSDTQATLPANYTFPVTDKGVHSFTLAFATAGTQSVTVTDTANSSLTTTQSGINVAPAAPINLSAKAMSTSQISLTWTGSAGATGYLIQRSLNGSSGWTQIGSTSGNATSYQDSGLSAGTTYYYRVLATGGNVSSAPSNVASATTTSSTTTVDTIWSNSYVPSENAYSWGSYELGVKFTANVTGQVTGVRFYKQTWMGGYTHVGHVWSSTGTLLATATFTNETAYGWQQVTLSTPVTIQANTVYVVSFSTGGGYFGISTNFFTNSGVSNGPLSALANGVSGGDGVYQSSGDFPNVSGSGMNFWADVAFTPTSGTSTRAGSGSTPASPLGSGVIAPAISTGSTRFALVSPTAATPTGPAGFLAGSWGTTTVAGGDPSLPLGAWSSRRTVSQAGRLGSGLFQGLWSSGTVQD
jgi:hypothetical protein